MILPLTPEQLAPRLPIHTSEGLQMWYSCIQQASGCCSSITGGRRWKLPHDWQDSPIFTIGNGHNYWLVSHLLIVDTRVEVHSLFIFRSGNGRMTLGDGWDWHILELLSRWKCKNSISHSWKFICWTRCLHNNAMKWKQGRPPASTRRYLEVQELSSYHF